MLRFFLGKKIFDSDDLFGNGAGANWVFFVKGQRATRLFQLRNNSINSDFKVGWSLLSREAQNVRFFWHNFWNLWPPATSSRGARIRCGGAFGRGCLQAFDAFAFRVSSGLQMFDWLVLAVFSLHNSVRYIHDFLVHVHVYVFAITIKCHRLHCSQTLVTLAEGGPSSEDSTYKVSSLSPGSSSYYIHPFSFFNQVQFNSNLILRKILPLLWCLQRFFQSCFTSGPIYRSGPVEWVQYMALSQIYPILFSRASSIYDISI